MNFLNPIFLAGLAAAAIPLLIFLWNRNRRPVVRVSSLFLFRQLEASSIRTLKLAEWLLLALRILILLLLALAFAQPFLQSGSDEQPVYRSVILDWGPGFSSATPAQKTGLQQWLETLSREQPSTRFFTTDSLNGYQPSRLLQPWWFQGVPAIDTSGPSLLISSVGSPVLPSLMDRLPSGSDVILYETPGITGNLGISGVSLPSGWWQTRQPNQVRIDILNPTGEETRAEADVLVNGLLIRTVPLTLTGPTASLTVPVTVNRRGWHTLSVQLKHPDFEPDNHWSGGFYLPETLQVVVLSGRELAALNTSRLQQASLSAGFPLVLSARSADLGKDRLLIITSSRWSGIMADHPAAIWIPDFSQPGSITESLQSIGLSSTVNPGMQVMADRYTDHPFLSYLDRKDPADPDRLLNGLVTIRPVQGLRPLLTGTNREPVMSLYTRAGRQVLIFHVNPFTGPEPVPAWALSALLHALTALQPTASTRDGFFAHPVRTGIPFPVPVAAAGIRFRFLDQEWIPGPGTLSGGNIHPAMITRPGTLTIWSGDRLTGITGFNAPAIRQADSPEEAIRWQPADPFPLLTAASPRFLSAGIFIAVLLLLLLEMILSRGRR
ncbi:MAG: BatA domain-containing protein [Bacteroidetes bacterium]|nr:BatA domain-containing protein [Bacteroidota bacterium]